MAKKVFIAGAGPAGLLIAKELANAGMEVVVFEALDENQYSSQHNWSDALEIGILDDVGLPVPEMRGEFFVGNGVKKDSPREGLYEQHRISQLAVYAPDYSIKTVTDADFRHVLVDRQELRNYQVQQTRKTGVTIRFACPVIGLLGRVKGELPDIEITGIRVKEGNESVDMPCDLVIDATGQYARLRTMLEPNSIGKSFPDKYYGYVYRTVRRISEIKKKPVNVSADQPPFRDHYRLRSSKGYSFLHFHNNNTVDIGGGAPHPIPPKAAKKIVLDTIGALPQIGEEVRGGEGRNLKCMPPDSMVTNGFIVVGHAAAQINPTQGCGIGSSYAGALLAAQIIKSAERFDIGSLWAYNYRWFTGRGAHYAALFLRLKDLNVEDLCFLIRKNIINGETLTNDYNGYYLPVSTNEARRITDAFPHRPNLMSKWKAADEASKRCFDHFLTYPKNWDPSDFSDWIRDKGPEA